MKIIRFIIIGLVFFNNTFSQTFEKTINDNLFNTVFPGRNIQVTANGDYVISASGPYEVRIIKINSELTTVGFDPVFGAGKILLYKESNITGKYNIVNSLQNFETGVVNDTSSYPVTKSNRYKIKSY